MSKHTDTLFAADAAELPYISGCSPLGRVAHAHYVGNARQPLTPEQKAAILREADLYEPSSQSAESDYDAAAIYLDALRGVATR